MCHPDVTVMDAVYAVVLLESSVDGRSWDGILRGPLTFNLLVLFIFLGAWDMPMLCSSHVILINLAIMHTYEGERQFVRRKAIFRVVACPHESTDRREGC